jgi:hypothetical protein
MTTNMITAARLLAHKSVNGRYQSLLAIDQFPVLGHQMVYPMRRDGDIIPANTDLYLARRIQSTASSRTRRIAPRPCILVTRAPSTPWGTQRLGSRATQLLTLAHSVYADSSPNLFDDPKVETIVELLTRIWVGDGHAHGAFCTS